jgi:protein XRP2
VVHLYAKTDPIVEKSHGMTFRPFNGSYPRLDAHFRAAGLDPRYSHWRRVFDFSADDGIMPRPHWRLEGEAVALRACRSLCCVVSSLSLAA